LLKSQNPVGGPKGAMGAQPSLVRIALAGQPNTGKSTVFNALTGLNQHVGNWAGKTVEKKTGYFVHEGRRVEIVDLPGTYSLTCGSEEERVTRDYLVHDTPDAVIAVVNAASLERNLYLVAELLVLPVPVVVGLNMVDVADAHGLHVDANVLEAALQLPVIELVASKGRGISQLVDAALAFVDRPETYQPNRPVVRAKHRPVLASLVPIGPPSSCWRATPTWPTSSRRQRQSHGTPSTACWPTTTTPISTSPAGDTTG
jgi:ferrous iron transport protein B